MILGDKIKNLRTKREMTQEQLAEKLFVSRTAVSKWERNAGYPNIDSLKLIAEVFEVTIDQLLCNEEIIFMAKEEKKNTVNDFIGFAFAILDLMATVLLFLPIFDQQKGDKIILVNLFKLTDFPLYLSIPYYFTIFSSIASGISLFILSSIKKHKVANVLQKYSVLISSIALLLFIITQEPYAAVIIFIFLAIKTFLIIKRIKI